MSLSRPQLRRLVKRALAGVTGPAGPEPARLARCFNSLCTRLRERLRPLFGATAVDALFARAFHVATVEFPWLAEVIGNNDECIVDAVTIQQIETKDLEEGLAVVLVHAIGLLSTFVGEDLVLPLVQEAWGDTTMPAKDQPGTEGDQ
jgi:hypothetical protein